MFEKLRLIMNYSLSQDITNPLLGDGRLRMKEKVTKKTKAFIKLRRILLKRPRLCWILNPSKKKTQPQMDNPENEKIDIEKEYMPHMWSTRFQTPEKVLHQYILFLTTESEKATNYIPHEIDVMYGRSPGQNLDIFGTDLPDDAPILVYVHGGYWKQISKDMSRFPAVSLHKAGVKTVVIGYDQRQHVTIRNIVGQVEDAVIYVMKYAEEMGSRGVYLAGHGSGAHLVAQVISNCELFDRHAMKHLNGVFFISGLYDLRDFCLTTANAAVKLSTTDAISFSPLFNSYTHLEDSNVRFYILAAEEGGPTFISQSRDFYHLLFDVCPMENMYFEIKYNMDHYDMVKCLTNENNYLEKLILHDLNNHSK